MRRQARQDCAGLPAHTLSGSDPVPESSHREAIALRLSHSETNSQAVVPNTEL